MKLLLILIAYFLLTQIAIGQTLTGEFQFEGMTRTYRIYLPVHYKPQTSLPLIIHFHGYSSTATIDQNYTHWRPISDTANFIVVYPNGLKDNQGYQYWNVGWPWLPNTNDVGFASALIDTIHSRYNINLHKVYAVGFSNGGFMAYILGAKLSNRIAAVASVSGGMVPGVLDTIVPERSIPTLEIHGTADELVPFYGGNGQFASANTDSVFYFWGRNNECDDHIDTTNLPDLDMSDGSTVQRFSYADPSCTFESRLYKIIDGVHLDWPGTGSQDNHDMNAGIEIWNFLKKYEIENLSSVEDEVSVDFFKLRVFPLPAKNRVEISFNHQKGTKTQIDVAVINTKGNVVINKGIEGDCTTIQLDISSLPSGVYFVNMHDGIHFTSRKLLKT